MAHREIRDDERCARNAFLGVHVWEFTTKSRRRHGESERYIDSVTCRACGGYPSPELLAEMVAKFEGTVGTSVLSDDLAARGPLQAVK